MKCPNCNVNLLIAERQGIQIDYCPECRGVWLERGKFDMIMERSTKNAPSHSPQNEHEHDHDHERYGHHGRRRRGGWLSELFD